MLNLEPGADVWKFTIFKRPGIYLFSRNTNMRHNVFFTVDAFILCLGLFAACILMVILGIRIRQKYLGKDDQESKGGVNSLVGALFGLWGFILAFTFGNSYTRFETVRTMMVEEANIIRTVILRTETLPDSMRTGFREDLKKYLQARIDYYEQATDAEKFKKSIDDARETGKSLWVQAASATVVPGFSLSGNNMMNNLSAMYDIGARRDALLLSGIPAPISFMLFFMAIMISFIGGFTSLAIRAKEWILISGFILLACIIVFITMDLARPMRGIIKPDIGQEKIVQLQKLL
jgi:hypothetical protein